MYVIPGLALLAAILSDRNSSSGGSPAAPGDVTAYGAGEQRRWAYGGTALASLVAIDKQMNNAAKKILGMGKAYSLYKNRARVYPLNKQRDMLVARGLSQHDPSILQVEGQIRQTINTILEDKILGATLERGVDALKRQRDKLLVAAGPQAIATYWEKFGGVAPADDEAFGQLSRADVDWIGDVAGWVKQGTGERPVHPEHSGPPLPIAPGFTFGQLQRTDMFGALEDRWNDAWYGVVTYSGDRILDRLSQLESMAMKIVKKLLGWKAATKGPRLLALNNQRDKLIIAGASSTDPQVINLQNQAMAILQSVGMVVGSPDHQQLTAIGNERDALLRQKGTA
jgi:hypothetical protein